jgi:hypothetical protein
MKKICRAIDSSEYVPVVLAAAEALPTLESIQDVLKQVALAQARGYFLPDEDERLREVYSRYLAIRTSLLECIYEISEGRFSIKSESRLPDFIVAYAAACLLVRAASFIVEIATGNPVGLKKLDEPEPRYGLKAKNFTRIYKSLTSPRKWWGFYEAVRFFRMHRNEILAYREDAVLNPVVKLLLKEETSVVARRDDFLKRRLGYRIHSFLSRNHLGYRKIMFGLFKMSGSTIASLRQPFVKPVGMGKRVTKEVREQLRSFLQPGDVLVTRHDDALSNLFLPGFWPHVAFCVGSNQQRDALGVVSDAVIEDEVLFLEAKKDGVKLRPPEDTLQVDAFVVLRPALTDELKAEAISRCLTHTGKQYDFLFDFSTSDRLACTELVYRSYHGVGEVVFKLESYAGRFCLPAEALINQAVGNGWFEPVLIYGVKGNDWIEGNAARTVLKQSFESVFSD